jgi:hypothetical protein
MELGKIVRVFLAAALSPIVPPFLYFVGMAFVSGYTQQGPGHMEKLVQLVLGFGVLSYTASLVFGALTILTLYKLKRLTVLNVLLWSFACGFLAGLAFDILIYWPRMHEIMITALVFGALGGIAGLMVSGSFCIIAGLFSKRPIQG